MKSMKLFVTRETISKEVKSLVPVDTITKINLKIVARKIDVICKPHNVIKDTITRT